MPINRRHDAHVLCDKIALPLCLATILSVLGLHNAAAVAGAVSVYTDAQALTGRNIYYQTCAVCHGQDLTGKVGPALIGRQFHQMVAAQHMTAPLLMQFITTQMPQTKPGSLTPTQCSDIMAFILKQNGFPSGDKPLSADDPDLGKVDLSDASGGG